MTTVLVVGLGIGALTSILQTYLGFPWLALANSASPWLVPAFAVGLMQGRARTAAVAGLVTCVLEVAGYYLTTELRGFAAGLSFVLFWAACALVCGPLFGVAGWLWRSGPSRLRGLGAAVVAAAFLSEGLIGYEVRLGYASSAELFALLGVAAAIALGCPGGRLGSLARWLLPALAAGVLAELLLGLIYGGTIAAV